MERMAKSEKSEKKKKMVTLDPLADFIDTPSVRAKVRRELAPIAIETYRHLMLNAQDEKIRKSAADAVMEIEGSKSGKALSAPGAASFQVSGDFLKIAMPAVARVAAARAPQEAEDVIFKIPSKES